MGRLDDLDLSKSLSKKEEAEELERVQARLAQLRLTLAGLLPIDGEHKLGPPVLVLIEGWDASGKGGAIKRLVEPLDPRHVRVSQFAAPTHDEKRHHFLWRFWAKLPGWGGMTIFDRSWYGRVLVERVENFATREQWLRAYDEINHHERTLASEGMILVKLWLHISAEEQLKRFESRKEDPLKSWKLTDEDWRNREKREAYAEAIEDMLARTDEPMAPWTVIEGDSKRYARVAVIENRHRADGRGDAGVGDGAAGSARCGLIGDSTSAGSYRLARVSKPRLHAVPPATPEQMTEAVAADAKSAVAGLGDAAGAARRETTAELAAELREIRHELVDARHAGAEAERRAREAEAALIDAELRERELDDQRRRAELQAAHAETAMDAAIEAATEQAEREVELARAEAVADARRAGEAAKRATEAARAQVERIRAEAKAKVARAQETVDGRAEAARAELRAKAQAKLREAAAELREQAEARLEVRVEAAKAEALAEAREQVRVELAEELEAAERKVAKAERNVELAADQAERKIKAEGELRMRAEEALARTEQKLDSLVGRLAREAEQRARQEAEARHRAEAERLEAEAASAAERARERAEEEAKAALAEKLRAEQEKLRSEAEERAREEAEKRLKAVEVRLEREGAQQTRAAERAAREEAQRRKAELNERFAREADEAAEAAAEAARRDALNTP